MRKEKNIFYFSENYFDNPELKKENIVSRPLLRDFGINLTEKIKVIIALTERA